ncbi:MAG: FGGY family carbohydrate kinase [Deinococcota bacterium]
MWLALDIGTTNVKAALLDADRKVHFRAEASYPSHSATGGISEQNSKDWWLAACQVMQDLNLQAATSEQVGLKRVIAVAITGQMQDVLLLDAAGEPLRPVILYSDSRAQAEAAEIDQLCAQHGYDLTKITGNVQTAAGLLAKLRWLNHHEAEVMASADKLFLGAAELVAYKLTGAHVSDTTTAATTGLMDLEARAWLDKDVFERLELPNISKLLPQLVSGGTQVGTVSTKATTFLDLPEGIPVHLGPGDAGATTLGAGCGDLGSAYGYIGTTGWWAFSSTERGNSTRGVFTLAHPHLERTICVVPFMAAGKNLEWIANTLSNDTSTQPAYDDLIQTALARPISPIIYLPYLSGEPSLLQDPNARGAFIGLASEHTQADVVRAVLEGVSFAYKYALDALVSPPPQQLTLTGGGSRSRAWCQLLADVTGVSVRVVANASDVGLQGAVLAAQVARGEYEGYELEVASSEVLSPQQNTIYNQKYELFQRAYASLKDVFQELSELS